jgi:hypothetical protein
MRLRLEHPLALTPSIAILGGRQSKPAMAARLCGHHESAPPVGQSLSFLLPAATVTVWIWVMTVSSVYERIDNHGRVKQALGCVSQTTRPAIGSHNLGRHQTAMGIKSRLFRFAYSPRPWRLKSRGNEQVSDRVPLLVNKIAFFQKPIDCPPLSLLPNHVCWVSNPDFFASGRPQPANHPLAVEATPVLSPRGRPILACLKLPIGWINKLVRCWRVECFR